MATPSSSVTSASPPMSYLQARSAAASPASTMELDPKLRNERREAVQKFLARAQVSMITRGLRARLSYASYKASRNIPHVPLPDLEAQTQNQPASPARVTGGKRKASGLNNYFNNPATQSASSFAKPVSNIILSPRKGTMAPPSVSSSAPRAQATDDNSQKVPQSLFTTLLGPPPTKQARTVCNPSDPPVQASTRQSVTARIPRGVKTSNPSTQTFTSRSRATTRHNAEEARTPARDRKTEGTHKDKRGHKKGRTRERPVSPASTLTVEDPDVERKAAATLTSLMLHSRTSIASVSSPRSSLSAGSDVGSAHSFSQFAQSSTRTTTSSNTTSLFPSAESSFAMANNRSATPPLHPASRRESKLSQSQGSGVFENVQTTPRTHASTDDSEAASLMLYLATSPSPARPANARERDAKDSAAYRALGGATDLRTKGRVLFAGPSLEGQSKLKTEGSFASSVASMSLDSDGADQNNKQNGLPCSLSPPLPLDTRMHSVDARGSALAPPTEPVVIPPTPTLPTPMQLLPPPPSPTPSSRSKPAVAGSSQWSYLSMEPRTAADAPPTPGSLHFNLNDFINVSPSPAAPHRADNDVKTSLNSGITSRVEIGRKLFEEEQQQHSSRDPGDAARNIVKPGPYLDSLDNPQVSKNNLSGAGIDAVRS